MSKIKNKRNSKFVTSFKKSFSCLKTCFYPGSVHDYKTYFLKMERNLEKKIYDMAVWAHEPRWGGHTRCVVQVVTSRSIEGGHKQSPRCVLQKREAAELGTCRCLEFARQRPGEEGAVERCPGGQTEGCLWAWGLDQLHGSVPCTRDRSAPWG